MKPSYLWQVKIRFETKTSKLKSDHKSETENFKTEYEETLKVIQTHRKEEIIRVIETLEKTRDGKDA